MDLRARWTGWRRRIASSRTVAAFAEGARKVPELGRHAWKQGRSFARAARARAGSWRTELGPAAIRLRDRVTDLAAATRGRLALWCRQAAILARQTLAPVQAATRSAVVESAWRAGEAWARLTAASGTLRLRTARSAQRVIEAAAQVRRRLAATPVAQRAGAGVTRAAARLRSALQASPLAPALRRAESRLESRRQAPLGRYRIEVATPRSRAFAVAGACLLAVLAALPAFGTRNLINELIFVLTMLALAQYWNLLAGYAGLVSVGQQAFVGLGGYMLFALTIHQGVDPLVAILTAGVMAAVLAVPTALVVFRLRGAYFAIGTWVVAEVFRLVLAQFRALGGGTGTSLPPFVTNEVAGIAWVKAWLGVSTSAARDIITYWAALALAAGTVLLVYFILRSRYGLALAAIRDSERAAESVGVDNFKTKLKVYIAAAAGTGMVGALIYLQKARISPDAAFSVLDWTANVIFIVVIGGIGTIEGPIIGVLVFYVLQTNLAHFGTWYLILLGAFAIVIMLFAPKGIWGYLADRYGFVLFPIRRRLLANPGSTVSGGATAHQTTQLARREPDPA